MYMDPEPGKKIATATLPSDGRRPLLAVVTAGDKSTL
jgi:hypothetical protein